MREFSAIVLLIFLLTTVSVRIVFANDESPIDRAIKAIEAKHNQLYEKGKLQAELRDRFFRISRSNGIQEMNSSEFHRWLSSKQIFSENGADIVLDSINKTHPLGFEGTKLQDGIYIKKIYRPDGRVDFKVSDLSIPHGRTVAGVYDPETGKVVINDAFQTRKGPLKKVVAKTKIVEPLTETAGVPRNIKIAQGIAESLENIVLSLPAAALECYLGVFASAVAEYKKDCDQYRQFIADSPDRVASYQQSYIDNLAREYLNLKYTRGSWYADIQLRAWINENPPFPWISKYAALPVGELRYVWDPRDPNIQAWQKEFVNRIKTRADEKEMDLKKSLENNNSARGQESTGFFGPLTKKLLNLRS